MSRPILDPKQQITPMLSGTSGSLRASMSPGEIIAAWAERLLDAGGYSRIQRQQLHNLTRVERIAVGDRSGFGVILELAPLAAIGNATWGPELMRTEIIGRGNYRLPCPEDAHNWEEEANRSANVAQRRHRECRTRSTLYDLTDSMFEQALSSQIVSASEAADFRGR